MDYKYIEQLLERYWACETSLEEEAILKTFFAQTHIPEHLKPFQELFAAERMLQEARLSEDFEAKLSARLEEKQVTIREITWKARLMPLYKAVASIAIILTLGNAAHRSFNHNAPATCDYNYESYEDSYNDPQMAYEQMSDALQMVSQSLHEPTSQDSLAQHADTSSTPE